MSADPNVLARLSQTGRELSTCFDAQLRSMGLTAARGKVLLFLARNQEGISQAGITDLLRVEHPTAVRILDGLESLGHIRRLPDLNDRRAKVIVLTETGKPLADQVVILTERLNEALMEGFGPADSTVMNTLLLRLLSNLAAVKSSMPHHFAEDETVS